MINPIDEDMSVQKKKAEEAAKLIALVTTGTGIVLMLFGLFCLTNMQAASAMLHVDITTLTIISWALIGAGLIDLGLARFFMNKAAERR